jgi:hypothetical protein
LRVVYMSPVDAILASELDSYGLCPDCEYNANHMRLLAVL